MKRISDDFRESFKGKDAEIEKKVEAFIDALKKEANDLADQYYGPLITAVRTDREADWKSALEQFDALSKEADTIKSVTSSNLRGYVETLATGDVTLLNAKVIRNILALMLSMQISDFKKYDDWYHTAIKRLRDVQSIVKTELNP